MNRVLSVFVVMLLAACPAYCSTQGGAVASEEVDQEVIELTVEELIKRIDSATDYQKGLLRKQRLQTEFTVINVKEKDDSLVLCSFKLESENPDGCFLEFHVQDPEQKNKAGRIGRWDVVAVDAKFRSDSRANIMWVGGGVSHHTNMVFDDTKIIEVRKKEESLSEANKASGSKDMLAATASFYLGIQSITTLPSSTRKLPCLILSGKESETLGEDLLPKKGPVPLISMGKAGDGPTWSSLAGDLELAEDDTVFAVVTLEVENKTKQPKSLRHSNAKLYATDASEAFGMAYSVDESGYRLPRAEDYRIIVPSGAKSTLRLLFAVNKDARRVSVHLPPVEGFVLEDVGAPK